MAERTTSARPSFHEVVFQGKPKVVRAFVSGLIMGSGLDATVFWNYDEGIEHDGTAKRLVGMVGIGSRVCHVIVDKDTAALLRKLRKRIEVEMGLHILEFKRIKSARVAFKFHTYAPQYHRQIIELLQGLPKGLKLEDFWTDVQEDPKAKGVEAYTAVHEFSSSGKGAVTGRLDLLVAFKAACAKHPLIEMEDVKLVLA